MTMHCAILVGAALFFVGGVDQVDGADAVSDSAFHSIVNFTKILPTQLVSGALCWNHGTVNRLSLELSKQGVYFQNFGQLDSAMLIDLLLVDAKCENRLKEGIPGVVRNVLVMNSTLCDEKLQLSLNITFENMYVLNEISNNVVKCHEIEKKAFAKQRASNMHVVYVASSETAKNLKEFGRHLEAEATSRFNYEIFSELFTFLNLTHAIEGSIVSDVHSLDKLSLGTKELIVYPLSVTKENFTTYNFLTSRTPHRRSFLFRAPTLSSVSNVFTLPLDLNVWYASYTLLAIILIVIYAIVKVEWRFPDMISNKYRIMYPRMMDVVQMHVGAIAQQGSEAEPTSGGGRVATFFVFLFFLFLYTAYSANIVALLGSTTTRVHGVADLRKFSIKLGIDKELFNKPEFQNEQSKEHQALFREKLSRDECYLSVEQAIDRIRNEFFAFYSDNDLMYKMINRLYSDNEKCGFVEIPYLSEPDRLIPIQKNSTYSEVMKIGMAILFERGVHHRIKSVVFAEQPQCYIGGSNFVNVSLLDCYLAFMIYGGGTVMSFAIFVMELIVARSKIYLTSQSGHVCG